MTECWIKCWIKLTDKRENYWIRIKAYTDIESSVDRLYQELREVEGCVELERSNLFDYAAKNNERLLKAATEELQLRTNIVGKNKEERENERQAAWKEKALHGQFLRETEGMQDQRRWQWLKAGELKRETESLICAAQEQALRTNNQVSKQ